MASNIIGDRKSAPGTSSSSLVPPSSRTAIGGGHHFRSSADITGSLAGRGVRPSSEYTSYGQLHPGHASQDDSTTDKVAQQWLDNINQYEGTLEEMAHATLDQDFKDELQAIEQWFRVLSEAERTAALYALLQQTTQVQIRFFIGVLEQMAGNHPMSGMLSPANFGEKDPMSNRLSTAMNKLNGDGARSSMVSRPPPTPGAKRNSQLDPEEINSMFPDAAAAIAKQKAAFTESTGTAPTSNRSSAVIGDRLSSVREDPKKDMSAAPSAWNPRGTEQGRPKSSSSQQPMGQFSQPATGTSLRSPRPVPGDANAQSANMNPPTAGLSMLSPYQPGGSWASMVNTPMTANFQHNPDQANMVANATAMKLQALSTVNNRIHLDDARKYRRGRSTDGQGPLPTQPVPQVVPQANFVMTNEHGEILTPQQVSALQAQQIAAMQRSGSRPSSPGIPMQGAGLQGMNMSSQQNGYLAAFEPNATILANGMQGMHLGGYGVGMGGEGYLSDASEINRGRSPRGKRGTSRPPEDPTDLELLRDIPAWLRSLRLHKYNDNLKDLKWEDMVKLDDNGLQHRGIEAKGARNKLLKVFEQVREAHGM